MPKKHRNRIIKTPYDIAVIASYSALLCVVLSICFYLQHAEYMTRLNDGFLSEEARAFSFSGSESEFYKAFDNAAVYFLVSEDANMKAVIVKGATEAPPLIKGRFFTEDDYDAPTDVAVIGQYVADELNKKLDDTLFIHEKPYQIIGITGVKQPTSMDYVIWYALKRGEVWDTPKGIIETNQLPESASFDLKDKWVRPKTLFEVWGTTLPIRTLGLSVLAFFTVLFSYFLFAMVRHKSKDSVTFYLMGLSDRFPHHLTREYLHHTKWLTLFFILLALWQLKGLYAVIFASVAILANLLAIIHIRGLSRSLHSFERSTYEGL